MSRLSLPPTRGMKSLRTGVCACRYIRRETPAGRTPTETGLQSTMFSLAARRSASFLPRFFSPRLMSTFGDNCPLVLTPRQLSDLDQSKVSILDASWHMPNSPRKAREEFLKQHIPGAQYLDLDEVASEHELDLKHMMPSPEKFAQACGARTPVHILASWLILP